MDDSASGAFRAGAHAQGRASLAESPDAEREGLAAVQAYEAKYGALGDQPLDLEQPFEFPHTKIERREFEEIWRRARDHLEGSR